jgi:hypothetical protein
MYFAPDRPRQCKWRGQLFVAVAQIRSLSVHGGQIVSGRIHRDRRHRLLTPPNQDEEPRVENALGGTSKTLRCPRIRRDASLGATPKKCIKSVFATESGATMTRIAVAVATLAALIHSVGAQPLPQPKIGQCPAGYASEAAYCVPMRRDAPVAVPRVGQCPSGFVQSGNYCIDARRRAELARTARAGPR